MFKVSWLILLLLLAGTVRAGEPIKVSGQKSVEEILQEEIMLVNGKTDILYEMIKRSDLCPSGWQESPYLLIRRSESLGPPGYLEVCPDNGLIRVKPKEKK